jgi:nucleotide-binding universal stress UspA family protein
MENGCENNQAYCPKISFRYEEGEVVDVVKRFIGEMMPELVVMGLTGAGHLVQLALGSNSKKMIDVASRPVLYVPFSATFRPLRKIIFASDLEDDNLEVLQHLVGIASPFGAEIIVYHVSNYRTGGLGEQYHLDHDFQERVISKLAYQQVRYHNLWHDNVDTALEWMRSQDGVDLLAMVHRRHSILDMLVHGSHTHKSSRLTSIPMLVYQTPKK